MDRGFVITDERLHTNLPHVYAVGDIVPGLQLAHRGFQQGIFVAEEIAGLNPDGPHAALAKPLEQLVRADAGAGLFGRGQCGGLTPGSGDGPVAAGGSQRKPPARKWAATSFSDLPTRGRRPERRAGPGRRPARRPTRSRWRRRRWYPGSALSFDLIDPRQIGFPQYSAQGFRAGGGLTNFGPFYRGPAGCPRRGRRTARPGPRPSTAWPWPGRCPGRRPPPSSDRPAK